jgi:hypothetical protein
VRSADNQLAVGKVRCAGNRVRETCMSCELAINRSLPRAMRREADNGVVRARPSARATFCTCHVVITRRTNRNFDANPVDAPPTDPERERIQRLMTPFVVPPLEAELIDLRLAYMAEDAASKNGKLLFARWDRGLV